MMRESLGLRYGDGVLEVLDQTLLPHEEKWIRIKDPSDMSGVIKRLAVRGAPLIGVAAALSWGDFALREQNPGGLRKAWTLLRDSRPTAVNLMHAMDRCLLAYEKSGHQTHAILDEALKIFDEDQKFCEGLAEGAARLIQDGDGVLTHCNTGGLATVGVGTALAGIKRAHKQGKRIHVYVDETRPLGQGARLTTWELTKAKVPFTLICDNMAGALMAKGQIQKVFVGADRIAKNGDSANKIGTYSAAVLAHFHHVPFYVVAPSTTFDPNCPTGSEIPIEERNADEVRGTLAAKDCPVWNPSFDVTPASLITAIVLENRIWKTRS